MILEKLNKKVNLKKIQVVFLLEIGNRQEFQILHLAMDGDRDGGPCWNTGLNSLGPSEKQKEEEREQGGQGQREPSSGDGWRCRRRPTLEHRTEPPKVQRRSRRRKNMKKEIRTARGAITH